MDERMSECPFDPKTRLDLDSQCPKCRYSAIAEITNTGDDWRSFWCRTCGHHWRIVVDNEGNARAEEVARVAVKELDEVTQLFKRRHTL